MLAEGGPLVVDTGKHTGRSPKDKFVVREPGSEDRIWWGDVNQPLSRGALRRPARQGRRVPRRAATLYVVDAFAGADPAHRIAVRVVTPHAVPRALREDDVHRRRADDELDAFEPDALVLHAPALEADPDEDGTRTGTFIALHPTRTRGADRRHVLRGRDQEVDLHA